MGVHKMHIFDSTIAENAVKAVMPAIQSAVQTGLVKRPHLHIVVVSPKGEVLYERSIGNPDDWEYPYDEIALSKAAISVRTGRPTAEIQSAPQYLRQGDTQYYGSAVLDGIVVGVSGVQPYFDEMIATWIAATCRGLCKQKFAEEILPSGKNFIG